MGSSVAERLKHHRVADFCSAVIDVGNCRTGIVHLRIFDRCTDAAMILDCPHRSGNVAFIHAVICIRWRFRQQISGKNSTLGLVNHSGHDVVSDRRGNPFAVVIKVIDRLVDQPRRRFGYFPGNNLRI